MMRGDGCLAIEAVAATDIDRALEHEAGRRMQLADIEDVLSGSKFTRRAAGKTLGLLHLIRIEHGEHLVNTGVDQAHCNTPVERPLFRF